MSRTAGFGAVATVTEDTVNDVVASYAYGQLGPFFFPLPTTVDVGSTTVTFAGVVELDTPTVELEEDAQDRVTVHFKFTSTLRARKDDEAMQKWKVRWKDAVKVGVVTTVQDEQITVAIDTSKVLFSPLSVTVVDGGQLPNKIEKALESQELADAATAYVQSLPPITISPPMLASKLSYTQPLELPWVIAPEWFTVELEVDTIVVRPFEDALTVAVDFQGLTNGDPDGLGDLTKIPGLGTLYVETLSQSYDTNAASIVGQSEPTGGSMSFCVNLAVLSSVVADQIDPQVFDTMIYPDIALHHVAARYSPFMKDLVGMQDGLAVDVHVQVQQGPWFGVDGTIYLQVYLQTASGTTEFTYSHPDTWRVAVGRVDIDLPWWVDFAVAVLSLTFSVAFPVFSGMFVVLGAALIADVIPGLLANVESQAQLGIDDSANTLALPSHYTQQLPGLDDPTWSAGIGNLAITLEGLDMLVYTSPDRDVTEEPKATISPSGWYAYDTDPIPVQLKLRDDLARLNGRDLTLKWKVRRGDTNEVLLTETKTYDDPGGNGVSIPHHSAELYHVDEYVVHCRVTLALDDQVGEIWSGTETIVVSDILDRHHKYIQWGPHTVHFKNEGTGNSWWSHKRLSRIHRTAVSARCLMLTEAVKHGYVKDTLVAYTDDLEFPWSDLHANRKPLCEFCFFGGPDKFEPLPEEDWF